jgi:hypothetical protein
MTAVGKAFFDVDHAAGIGYTDEAKRARVF